MILAAGERLLALPPAGVTVIPRGYGRRICVAGDGEGMIRWPARRQRPVAGGWALS